MTILITGIGGHICSNVARMLIEEGEDVVGLDVAAPGSHSVLFDLAGRYGFVPGTITDLALLMNIVREHKVTAIIHGAVIQAEFANSRPLEATRVNIEGTLNVLEAARIWGLRKVVCCSSSSAGGEHKGRPLSHPTRENEIDLPLPTIYGLTKLTNEGQVHLYRTLYNVDAVACRPSRVWGPGYARFDLAPPIELLLREAFNGRAIRLGQGADTLIDYTFVKDIAGGLIRALRTDRTASTVFNMSSGRLVSLATVGEKLSELFPDVPIEIGPGEVDMAALNPHGGGYRMALRPAMDISRAQNELGYHIAYGIDKGLPAYATWLRERRYL